jgi:hypothetical protein
MLLPEDGLLIDAFHTSDGWRITFPTSLCPPKDTPFAFPTFPEYLDSLPDHERCAILRYNLLGSTPYDFTHALSNLENIILVSDGGARDDYGSYGWVFSHQNGTRFMQLSSSFIILSDIVTLPSLQVPSKFTATTKGLSRKSTASEPSALQPNLAAYTPNGTCSLPYTASVRISPLSHPSLT